MALDAIDSGAAEFAGRDFSSVAQMSARNESCSPLHNVYDIRFMPMHFAFARRVAATRMHLELRRFE